MATKPISPDEYFAVEFISKQLQLDKFTDSQIVDIRKAFQGSAKRMIDYAEKKYTAKYGKGGWTRDRYLKVLQDVAKLDESLRTSLVDKTKDVGKAVYISELAKFEDIVSVKGLSNKFEHINLSPEYLKAFNNKMAFDNKSLAHWVNYSFDKEVQEKIKNEIMADVIIGSSNQAIIKRLQQAYSDVDRTLIESMTRTHIQKANTVAFLDVAKQNSDIIKRVRWLATLDQRCCIICGALDGKDFDMNKLPYSPPIHPRCVTGDMVVYAPDVVNLMTSQYTGVIVDITLSDGNTISTSVKHMLLTPNGFVMAGFLAKSDYLFSTSNTKGVVAVTPDNDRNDTNIEQIVASFSKTFGVFGSVVPATAKDFHCEGVFLNKNIDIINTERFLENGINTEYIKNFSSNTLKTADMTGFFNSYCSSDFFISRDCATSHYGIGLSRDFLAFFRGCVLHALKHGIRPASCVDSVIFETQDYNIAANSIFFSQFFNRNTVVKFFDDCVVIDTEAVISAIIKFHAQTSFFKPTLDSIALTNTSNFSKACKRFSSHVSLVQIVDITYRHVINLPVYDINTLSSIYTCNGILSSNCRCIVTPITSTWKDLGVNMEELDNIRPDNFNKLKPMVTGKTYSQRFKDFTDDQKLDLLGKTRFELIKAGKLDFQDLVNFKTGELYRLEELDKVIQNKEARAIAKAASTISIKPKSKPESIISIKPKTDAMILRQKLNELESEICDRPIENAYIVDVKGNIILNKTGTHNAVTFTKDELSNVKGHIFTHNHPKGTSLSFPDVNFLTFWEMKEMRAVSGKHIHSFSLTKAAPSKDTAIELLKKEHDLANFDVRNELQYRLNVKGDITAKYAESEHQHMVWTKVAEKLSWINYRRDEWIPSR
jgi:SPP1 gp7 family putative phage head morphogenesis protein